MGSNPTLSAKCAICPELITGHSVEIRIVPSGAGLGVITSHSHSLTRG